MVEGNAVGDGGLGNDGVGDCVGGASLTVMAFGWRFVLAGAI